MRWIVFILGALLLVAGCASISKNQASPDIKPCVIDGQIEQLLAGSVACLYYQGTASFRQRNFSQAYTHWSDIILRDSISPQESGYISKTLNNIGYLTYHGFGVTQHQRDGIQYWLKAVAAGSNEPKYHLCYVYGDINSDFYAKVKAKKYCELAYEFYQDGHNPDILNVISQFRLEAQ